MPFVFNQLTPNLVVSDVARSIAFYRDLLGMTLTRTVPDEGPFVFASLECGPVEVFVNAQEAAVAEYPAFKGRPLGGTLTLFIQVTGIRAMHDALAGEVTVVMPLEKKWYGVTEFAFEDPDGYVLTFAEHDAPSTSG
jgi:catechol 2,3-dioxygenase-like lactoylglutathione lyase family enzyme